MPKIPLEELKRDKIIHATLSGVPLEFKTTWGLFCPEEIDVGTKLLLEHIPTLPKKAKVVDIGCGYGPIGITLAAKNKDVDIDMIDKDFVAIEYAEKNIALNKKTLGEHAHIRTFLSNGFSHVPAQKKYTMGTFLS
jgi:16S rRNA G1207 methylase RsmC